MIFLAKCNEDEVKSIKGKLFIPSENEKKDDKVFINLSVLNGDADVLNRLSGNEYCVTFDGITIDSLPDDLPAFIKGRVFNKVLYSDFCKNKDVYSVDVPLLVELEEGFSDMRVLYNYCMKYPQVRFIGGKLLGIPGIRIGRFEEGKEKMSSVYEGMYDSFVETSLSELNNIKEVVRRVKTRVTDDSSDKKRVKKEKVVKPNKKVASFKKLFNDEEVDF